LIEILTGEGKSIIIGFCTTIFALIGFEVHSVCYSSYLSERDYTAFLELFQFLKLEDSITYGTFNEISDIILQK
jgi:preprotein translocase subunit SecA